jgi:DNA-binding protein
MNLAKERRTKPEKPEAEESSEPVRKVGENVVLIGGKPVMNYVVACLTFFNAGEKEVVVKARGRAISRAVDTVELLRRGFIKDLTVQKIEIGTEEMSRPEGRKSNVSTIEITVVKSESNK